MLQGSDEGVLNGIGRCAGVAEQALRHPSHGAHVLAVQLGERVPITRPDGRDQFGIRARRGG